MLTSLLNGKSQVTTLLDIHAQLGEGAIWNPRTQTLWWIDIVGMKLNIFDPSTQKNTVFELPKQIGTVVPTNDGNALIALEDGIYKYMFESQKLVKVASPEPTKTTNRFNDGKCDPAGRFWVGSMSMKNSKQSGALYCIDGDFSSTLKIDSVTTSNGIVWSIDKTRMYYIDTPTKRVMEYAYNTATGEISSPRVAIEIPDTMGYPDGSTIDAEGMLWVALWKGHKVSRWNPVTGELLQVIDIPALNVTSCAFGGKNLDTLFITTASIGMKEIEKEMYPQAGNLFQVVPGVKGIPANFFIED